MKIVFLLINDFGKSFYTFQFREITSSNSKNIPQPAISSRLMTKSFPHLKSETFPPSSWTIKVSVAVSYGLRLYSKKTSNLPPAV
jgi:hypothetical protein